jgi:hypothetical protein
MDQYRQRSDGLEKIDKVIALLATEDRWCKFFGMSSDGSPARWRGGRGPPELSPRLPPTAPPKGNAVPAAADAQSGDYLQSGTPTSPRKPLPRSGFVLRPIGTNNGFIHPMHIHGGAFEIVACDGETIPASARFLSDMANVGPGQRYDVVWTARRPGKWLIHAGELVDSLDHNTSVAGPEEISALNRNRAFDSFSAWGFRRI